jgi:cephalosporin-C deacetylase
MSIPIKHPYKFDPTYGMSLEDLLAVQPPEAPPGFDAFWHARYKTALAVNPQPRLSESTATHPNWLVQDITFTSTEIVEITGWLLTPKDKKVTRGLVVGHGYGGRDAPDFTFDLPETALLFPCFRGLSRSRHAPISSDPAWHVLHDIDDPAHYILGGCVEDLWASISALTQLFPQTEGKIGYSGTSFGGGIGALAIPHDPRITRAQLVVPTFGNMPLWLTLPTTGSGNAVQNYRKTHPDIMDSLRFFDSAIAARGITVPALIAVARFDPAVAPPCQFSVANALPPAKNHEIVILDAGHFDYPGCAAQHAQLNESVRQFFGAL